MADELVKRFVDLHGETEQLLNQDKYKEARQKYLAVVKAYHDIHKSNLDGFHKELAYTQVNTLFRKVNIAKERTKIPYNLIAAAFLIMAFTFVIFLKPSIVGLAGYDDIMRTRVDLTFTESGVESVSLRERPLSLSVSGEFTGELKLYLKQGEKIELKMNTRVDTRFSAVSRSR